MSEHIPDFDHESYLVSAEFTFDGQVVGVVVRHDGFSYWTDKSGVWRLQNPEMSAAAIFHGDKKAADYIAHIYDEHTIRAPLPAADLKLIRDELSARFWADCSQDFDLDKQLEKIFEPIFWEHVSPYLSPPCTPPR